MKNTEPYYSEQQRFRQWWLWAILLPGPAFLFWATAQQFFLGFSTGKSLGDTYILLILTVIFSIGFPLFMYTTGLDTQVTHRGLYVRFRPFHRKCRVFEFENILEAEALTYSPLKDFGGWGIRYGKKGKAYSVSGNEGILLKLKNGKSVLIGSKKNEELGRAINQRILIN